MVLWTTSFIKSVPANVAICSKLDNSPVINPNDIAPTVDTTFLLTLETRSFLAFLTLMLSFAISGSMKVENISTASFFVKLPLMFLISFIVLSSACLYKRKLSSSLRRNFNRSFSGTSSAKGTIDVKCSAIVRFLFFCKSLSCILSYWNICLVYCTINN